MAKKPNMESELKKLLALCATKEEAEEHYSLFQDDDSGLYSSIEIIEEDL